MTDESRICTDTEIKGEEIKEGAIYRHLCCDGFDWMVRLVFLDENPNHNSIWGICHNPDCPTIQESTGMHDPYRGVSHLCQEDVLERLENKERSA